MCLKWCLIFCFFTFSMACPNGSVPYFNDATQCIYFQATPTYWLEAEEICMNLGGHLASIHNIFQNMFLSQQALLNFTKSSNGDFWIGANDLTKPGNWEWMDGTSFDYDDWRKGQPFNINGSDCGAVTMQGGKWKADDCYKTKPFVCLIQSLTTTVPAITTTTKGKPKNCDFGWTFYDYTEFCYKVYEGGTWQDAEDRCRIGGAHLTSIHSRKETLFLTNLANYSGANACYPPNQAWIGLYTDANLTHWKWTDDSPFDYSNWFPENPVQMRSYSCVYLQLTPACGEPEGTLANYMCDYELHRFICKKSAI